MLTVFREPGRSITQGSEQSAGASPTRANGKSSGPSLMRFMAVVLQCPLVAPPVFQTGDVDLHGQISGRQIGRKQASHQAIWFVADREAADATPATSANDSDLTPPGSLLMSPGWSTDAQAQQAEVRPSGSIKLSF